VQATYQVIMPAEAEEGKTASRWVAGL